MFSVCKLIWRHVIWRDREIVDQAEIEQTASSAQNGSWIVRAESKRRRNWRTKQINDRLKCSGGKSFVHLCNEVIRWQRRRSMRDAYVIIVNHEQCSRQWPIDNFNNGALTDNICPWLSPVHLISGMKWQNKFPFNGNAKVGIIIENYECYAADRKKKIKLKSKSNRIRHMSFRVGTNNGNSSSSRHETNATTIGIIKFRQCCQWLFVALFSISRISPSSCSLSLSVHLSLFRCIDSSCSLFNSVSSSAPNDRRDYHLSID